MSDKLVQPTMASVRRLILLAMATLITGATLFWSPKSSAAEGDSCLLTGVRAATDSVLSYRNRGDRCEGFYVRPVSGGKVRIVGFHAGVFADRPLAELSSLNIGLHGELKGSRMAVLLNFTRFNTFYAMDTRLPARENSYIWRTRLISQAIDRPAANELGILACTNNCQADVRALIPVALSKNPERFTDYTVLIKPEATLARLQYRLWNDSGDEPRVITLERRFAAGVTYPITLPKMTEGTWNIRIIGVSRSGPVGVATERLLISTANS